MVILALHVIVNLALFVDCWALSVTLFFLQTSFLPDLQFQYFKTLIQWKKGRMRALCLGGLDSSEGLCFHQV